MAYPSDKSEYCRRLRFQWQRERASNYPEIHEEMHKSAEKHRLQMVNAAWLLFADPGLVTRGMVENLMRYNRIDGINAALQTIDRTNFYTDSP